MEHTDRLEIQARSAQDLPQLPHAIQAELTLLYEGLIPVFITGGAGAIMKDEVRAARLPASPVMISMACCRRFGQEPLAIQEIVLLIARML